MHPIIILEYKHNYDVSILDEIPSPLNYTQYYFPGANQQGGRSGALIKIIPEGKPAWLGTFGKGTSGYPGAITGIFSLPDPNKLLVVVSGAGYIIDTHEPTLSQELKISPITDVRLILEQGLVILVDLVKITAFDASGFKWVTQRIGWDGIEILEVSESIVKGKYFDITSESEKEYTVNLENGECDGGVGGE